MKIYDCFMYSDEEMLLDIRLNSLDKFVDRFVIAEASYYHNGEPKKLNFNINNFLKFKDKIDYIVVNQQPPNVLKLETDKNQNLKEEDKIKNSILRDNFQREQLSIGINNLSSEDWVIISDLDEIPNLNKLNFNSFNNEILIFKQKMYYYKLNLYYKNFTWFGSKAIKKKNLISPQWLRNIKSKKYPVWRLDVYFSKKKFTNIKFIEDGGWHFSYLKKASGVEKKLQSIRHHIEYDLNPLGVEKIEKMINERKLIYNYKSDQRTANKFIDNEILNKLENIKLPEYIRNNENLFSEWLEK